MSIIFQSALTNIQNVKSGRQRNVKEHLDSRTGWMKIALLHVKDVVSTLLLSISENQFLLVSETSSDDCIYYNSRKDLLWHCEDILMPPQILQIVHTDLHLLQILNFLLKVKGMLQKQEYIITLHTPRSNAAQ